MRLVDKLQSYFTQQKLQCLCLDTDSFVLSMKTEKIIRDFKSLRNIFGFSKLDENHELFSYENKKIFLTILKQKSLKIFELINFFV